MNNRYSGSLLVIMLTLIGVGFISLFLQSLWGLVLLILGASMLLGLKQLPASPRTVGIVTFMSKKMPIWVEGYTLTLSWPIDIISVIPVEARRTAIVVKVENVRVGDGSMLRGNEITMTLGPDLTDDLLRTAGQKLILWDDNGQFKGVEVEVKKMSLEYLRAVCDKSNSYKEVVSDSVGMNTQLTAMLRGEQPEGTGNLRQLGGQIWNLQTDLVSSTKVQTADEAMIVEDLERLSESANTATFVEQAELIIRKARKENARRRSEGRDEDEVPSFTQAMQMVHDLQLLIQGKSQKISGGGININNIGGGTT